MYLSSLPYLSELFGVPATTHLTAPPKTACNPFSEGPCTQNVTLTPTEASILSTPFEVKGYSQDQLTQIRLKSSARSKLSQRQQIEQAGFTCEEHQVVTDDGYVLTMFRINDKSAPNDQGGKPAMMFQHGLMDSSYSWTSHTPEEAVPFQAARSGYDVWLGNNRGNEYANENINGLDSVTDDKEFHNYSFQELGDHDLPAQLDYVRAQSGRDKVTYVGHSQGTS